ncbi:PQQ-dependent sugar dehydrogenase [soil metagenome]
MATLKTLLSALMLALVLSACSSSSPAAPEPGATSPPDEGPATSNARPGPSLDTIGIELLEVAAGFEQPLYATHAGDASGRLFVVEQSGAVRIVSGGRVQTEPFLDLSERVVVGSEQGLLGLAFHPSYEDNGRLFVNYTDLNGDTVVAEFAGAGGRADSSSERVLLTIEQPFPNHNGGALAFGPDGFLYIATGDGGSGGDPMGNGQSIGTLLGKLLRIDVNAASSDLSYGIPGDNPFVGRAGARPEIWAYGLRNPWRFSFDEATEELWIGDVGQSGLEEIDHSGGGRGVNFGWNVMEGNTCYEPPSGCDRSELQLPVAQYSHDLGCSVTGGYVYRGHTQRALRGVYLFSDYCSGTIWGLDAAQPGAGAVRLLESGRAVSSFGVDETGELYLTDLGSGTLFRIVSK